MTRKLEKTFIATDPAGTKKKIKCYRPYRAARRPLTGPASLVPGLLELETEDGREVHVLGDGEYEVVVTGVKLHSDDPDRV